MLEQCIERLEDITENIYYNYVKASDNILKILGFVLFSPLFLIFIAPVVLILIILSVIESLVEKK